jgi:peptide deformylase
MAVRPVRIYGDPVLRQRAVDLTAVDETVRRLIEDMRETVKAYNGVGLAATQLGVAQRVLVVSLPTDSEERVQHALINPVITHRSGSETGEEGCLSIPGIWEEVARSALLRVRGLDLTGKPVEIEAGGFLARVIQHEIDHLDGVLFVDRLSALKRQFLRRSLESLARGELPEGYTMPAAGGQP